MNRDVTRRPRLLRRGIPVIPIRMASCYWFELFVLASAPRDACEMNDMGAGRVTSARSKFAPSSSSLSTETSSRRIAS
jgi:hypothetical protein